MEISATRYSNRGLRKCPKCNLWNGTRAYMCKNRCCNFAFKSVINDISTNQKIGVACKLNTPVNCSQIYSVRLIDKEPLELRGFVQLPQLESTESVLTSDLPALCFVESCHSSFQTNILKCHEDATKKKDKGKAGTICFHIELATNCVAEATPLIINEDILTRLKLTPNDIKQEIRDLIYEHSNTNLVQNISKNVMVVRCKVCTKHPLGYLHVSFFEKESTENKNKFSKKRKINVIDNNDNLFYNCSCDSCQYCVKLTDRLKCVHYYACVAAFASDTKLSQEFCHKLPETSCLLNSDIDFGVRNDENSCSMVAMLNSRNKDSEDLDEMNMTDSSFLERSDILFTSDEFQVIDDLDTVVCDSINIENNESSNQIHLNEENLFSNEVTDISCKEDSSVNIVNKKDIKLKVIKESGGKKGKRKEIDIKTTENFNNWLTTITESINIFNYSKSFTAENFFNLLRERIENEEGITTSISFTRYFAKIDNLTTIKKIFDTHLIEIDVDKFHSNSVHIVIDWKPNILPISKCGELKICLRSNSKFM